VWVFVSIVCVVKSGIPAEFATAYRTALGNLELIDEDVVTQGDVTAYRFILRGIHQAELLGVAPTSKRIEVRGVDPFHTRISKLTALWQVWDCLGFLEQVGAAKVR
jgi:predicted ester cyclase